VIKGTMPDYIPLSQRSVAMLRIEATQYRRMAATACMASTQSSLLRLADRIDALADERELKAQHCGGQGVWQVRDSNGVESPARTTGPKPRTPKPAEGC